MYAKILSSLLSLIMTEVRSKRRAFYPVIFTSICFKKPLLTVSLKVKIQIIKKKKMNAKKINDLTS